MENELLMYQNNDSAVKYRFELPQWEFFFCEKMERKFSKILTRPDSGTKAVDCAVNPFCYRPKNRRLFGVYLLQIS